MSPKPADPRPSEEQVISAMKQVEDNQRILDYETKEYTIEILVQKFAPGDDTGEIFAPDYQRRFSWETTRQSKFIESLLLGLPVPFLFFADTEDGRYEVVDGRQRLTTCMQFLSGDLELEGLDRLDLLNGFRFADLSVKQRRRFENRSIRSVVLSEKATSLDRRDMFERINTGSLIAMPAETRRGASQGDITDLIDELAADPLFLQLNPISDAQRRKRDGEERVTRFFAWTDGMDGYRDRVADFLGKWLRKQNGRAGKDSSLEGEYRDRFHRVMKFVSTHFGKRGFRKQEAARTAPRVRFDALSRGVWQAIKKSPDIEETGPRIPIDDWIDSDDFVILTTSNAANVRSKVQNRADYVMHMLLGDRKSAESYLPGDPEE